MSTLRCEKGLEHLDWVNFDQINNVVMEEWQSMRDITVLDGDTLHGSRVINEWGLGFGSSYLIKGRGWQPYGAC